MKKNYEAPQIEVIEIELEGVLCMSGDDALGIQLPPNFGNGIGM